LELQEKRQLAMLVESLSRADSEKMLDLQIAERDFQAFNRQSDK